MDELIFDIACAHSSEVVGLLNQEIVSFRSCVRHA